MTVCGQVAVRGPATEAGLNAAGLQLGAARCARGEDPPLVQLHQLAPHGGGQGHAALRARPTRSLCQGQHLEIFSNRGYDIRARATVQYLHSWTQLTKKVTSIDR